MKISSGNNSNKAKRGEYESRNEAYRFMQEEKHRWGCVMCWIEGGEDE